jgi:hypothetical protein
VAGLKRLQLERPKGRHDVPLLLEAVVRIRGRGQLALPSAQGLGKPLPNGPFMWRGQDARIAPDQVAVERLDRLTEIVGSFGYADLEPSARKLANGAASVTAGGHDNAHLEKRGKREGTPMRENNTRNPRRASWLGLWKIRSVR